MTSRPSRLTLVAKRMKLRDVEGALLAAGCVRLSDDGRHMKWGCPCRRHRTAVPRHRDVSPGVVRNIDRDMACLPAGWLT